MKKINITKKQYDESKYFTKKYGTLKYVSESGKLYKTDKGVVLALEGKECPNGNCQDGQEQENESLSDIGDAIKKTGGEVVDKVKKGVKKAATAVGDKFHGIYRKGDRVKIAGKAGDVEGAVVSAEPDKVVIKPDNERSFDESDDGSEEVTRGELTDMLKDVVDSVEQVCDAQDCSFEEVLGIEPDGESEEADADEVIATKDEVAEVLQDVIEKVEDVAEKAGIELPQDEEDQDDSDKSGDDTDTETIDECNATECGDKQKALESVKKAHRARLVREAIARRARAKKIHESVVRKARLRKIRESVARRARLRKIHESIAKRRARKAK